MTNHTPRYSTALEVFLDGAAGEFTAEDFDAFLAARDAEKWDEGLAEGYHSGGDFTGAQARNPYRVEESDR